MLRVAYNANESKQYNNKTNANSIEERNVHVYVLYIISNVIYDRLLLSPRPKCTRMTFCIIVAVFFVYHGMVGR